MNLKINKDLYGILKNQKNSDELLFITAIVAIGLEAVEIKQIVLRKLFGLKTVKPLFQFLEQNNIIKKVHNNGQLLIMGNHGDRIKKNVASKYSLVNFNHLNNQIEVEITAKWLRKIGGIKEVDENTSNVLSKHFNSLNNANFHFKTLLNGLDKKDKKALIQQKYRLQKSNPDLDSEQVYSRLRQYTENKKSKKEDENIVLKEIEIPLAEHELSPVIEGLILLFNEKYPQRVVLTRDAKDIDVKATFDVFNNILPMGIEKRILSINNKKSLIKLAQAL